MARTCPACSCPKIQPDSAGIIPEHLRRAVVVCARCDGIYTRRRIYLGESYEIVRPLFAPAGTDESRVRYFDLDTLGFNGADRRHGWFDPVSRGITQIG